VLLLILILVKGVEKLEGWKEDGNCAPVGRKGDTSVYKPERERGLASGRVRERNGATGRKRGGRWRRGEENEGGRGRKRGREIDTGRIGTGRKEARRIQRDRGKEGNVREGKKKREKMRKKRDSASGKSTESIAEQFRFRFPLCSEAKAVVV